jgi:DeoR/GlpR family transcriptional regulator of sugar metabolism
MQKQENKRIIMSEVNIMIQTVDLPQERRQDILEELRRNGKVVAVELSKRYQVSIDTIRRDLRDLAEAGLLKRVHGGALPITPITASYAERNRQDPSVKKRLARVAQQVIRDGQLIMFGGGTTNAEIARQLSKDLHATVVTVSPQIAVDLSTYAHLEVILIGGRLNKDELIITGAEAVEQLKGFQADICFLGVCSIHPEVGFTTNVYEEVALEQTLIEQSGEVVATVSADKLGTIAPYIVSPIDRITHIITEEQVSEDVLVPYRLQGVQVLQSD